MKTIILATAILMTSTFAVAQEDGMHGAGIRSHVDWSVSESLEQITVAGWVFDCKTEGQQPFNLRAYYQIPTDVVKAQILVRFNGLFRPDVAAAFPDCGRLNRYTGFQVMIGGIPSGPQRVILEWADSRGVRYEKIIDIVVQ